MEHERILSIQEYLIRYTDEKHDVNLKQICEHLSSKTNMKNVSLLTIRRDIDRLINSGADIRIRRGPHNTAYYHIESNGFTFNEIRFLVDSISINKFLSASQKKKLIRKFESMCSESELRQLISRISTNDIGEPSLDLLDNLEKIHRIISDGMKIDFDYGKFNSSKQMEYYSKKRDVIPVKVIFFEDHFYLKCINEQDGNVRTYRVDRMKNITEGEPADMIPELPDYDGVVLDMFEPERFECVKLRVSRFLLDRMLETFGRYTLSVTEESESDTVLIIAKIGISSSFYRWVMRYGENIEIVAPQSIRKTFAEKIMNIYGKYSDECMG